MQAVVLLRANAMERPEVCPLRENVQSPYFLTRPAISEMRNITIKM